MEYLIGLLVIAIGAAFYFKRKADDNRVDAIMGETRGRDRELREQQEDVEAAIRDLDKGISEIEREREKQKKEREKKSKEERADEWS